MSDPLATLLRPLADVLNRNIAASTPARELCTQLAGRRVAVRVRDTALAMVFSFADDGVTLGARTEAEADVVITGSLLTLARLAGPGAEDALHEGGIELSGNPGTARRFQDLLGWAKPDPEEELSLFVGDVAAHHVGEAARGFAHWAREAGRTMQANVREYLQEESRDVPSRYEVERFSRSVGTLRDDVARLEARLKQLESAG